MGSKNNGNLTVIARWPRLMRIEVAADYLGISPKTIRNGLGPKAEKPFPIKPRRLGRRVLFHIDDLNEYADSLPVTDYT